VSSETIGATGLAGRYAGALFELAEAEGQLDLVAGDLGRLRALIRENDDLHRMIRSPVIPRAEQAMAMAEILLQDHMCPLVRQFVGVVAQNRRLFALPSMIVAFNRILAEHRGEVSAQVISAAKLTETQTTMVADALEAAVGQGVALEAKVDPGLLGGLIIRVGSRMVDNSLGSKLNRLGLAMKGIG